MVKTTLGPSKSKPKPLFLSLFITHLVLAHRRPVFHLRTHGYVEMLMLLLQR
jgi:hypothetical protein